MIKDIVFDMGNVLIYFRPAYFIEKLGYTGSDAALLNHEIFSSPEWPCLDSGALTEDQALRLMTARLPERLHEAARKLVTMWDRPILEVPGMYDLIEDLKNRGYRIWLLSNASSRQHDYWERIPAHIFFDGTLISADVKMVKPTPGIFRLLCEKFELKAEECVFIDDSQTNIEGARQAGMHGILFTDDAEKLRKDLDSVLSLKNGTN